MQAHIKRKTTKEERLEMVKAGREDRGKYQARAAIKQKKVTQLSYLTQGYIFVSSENLISYHSRQFALLFFLEFFNTPSDP